MFSCSSLNSFNWQEYSSINPFVIAACAAIGAVEYSLLHPAAYITDQQTVKGSFRAVLAHDSKLGLLCSIAQNTNVIWESEQGNTRKSVNPILIQSVLTPLATYCATLFLKNYIHNQNKPEPTKELERNILQPLIIVFINVIGYFLAHPQKIKAFFSWVRSNSTTSTGITEHQSFQDADDSALL